MMLEPPSGGMLSTIKGDQSLLKYHNFVAGQWVPGGAGTIDVTNPANYLLFDDGGIILRYMDYFAQGHFFQ